MKYISSFVFISFAYAILLGGTKSSEHHHIEFGEHLAFFSAIRHPLYENGEIWRNSREYIKQKLQHFGLKDIREQQFKTSIGIKPNSDPLEKIEVDGINIIAVREGQTKSGPIIVIGTDYDTTISGDPLKNNGGGVAILLETVKLVEQSIRKDDPYFLNNTIIYVAFDVNTSKYSARAGMGPSGAYFFVHQWLNRYLESQDEQFLGAIILDSITTYNTNNNSQLLSGGFDSAFPEAFEDIKEDDSKGNFLGVVFKEEDAHNELKNIFIGDYHMDKTNRSFRLQEMEFHMNSSLILGDVVDLIKHQSHFPFWTNSLDMDLPALLLFDTEDDRETPEGDLPCNADRCNPSAFLTEERDEFMKATTMALARTLLDLQATKTKDSIRTTPVTSTTTDNGANSLNFSYIFILLSFISHSICIYLL